MSYSLFTHILLTFEIYVEFWLSLSSFKKCFTLIIVYNSASFHYNKYIIGKFPSPVLFITDYVYMYNISLRCNAQIKGRGFTAHVVFCRLVHYITFTYIILRWDGGQCTSGLDISFFFSLPLYRAPVVRKKGSLSCLSLTVIVSLHLEVLQKESSLWINWFILSQWYLNIISHLLFFLFWFLSG